MGVFLHTIIVVWITDIELQYFEVILSISDCIIRGTEWQYSVNELSVMIMGL